MAIKGPTKSKVWRLLEAWNCVCTHWCKVCKSWHGEKCATEYLKIHPEFLKDEYYEIEIIPSGEDDYYKFSRFKKTTAQEVAK